MEVILKLACERALKVLNENKPQCACDCTCLRKVMDYIKYLRAWIGFVGLTALGNTVQCYIDNSFVSERLYTATPHMGEYLKSSQMSMPWSWKVMSWN